MLKNEFGFAPMLAVIVALMVGGIGIGVYSLGQQISYRSKAATENAATPETISASLDQIEASNEAALAFKRNLDRAKSLPKEATTPAVAKKNLTLPDSATKAAKGVETATKATASAKPEGILSPVFNLFKSSPTPAPSKTPEATKAPVETTDGETYTNETYKFSLKIPAGMELRSGYSLDSSKMFSVEFQTKGYNSSNWNTPEHYKVQLIYTKHSPYTSEQFKNTFNPYPTDGVKVTTSTDTINGAPVLIIVYDYAGTSMANMGKDKYYYFYRENTALQFLGVGHKTEYIDAIAKSVKFL